ncbi:MAG: hypothetical protein BAJALOKI1v1_1390003 [Promethearchaeota archaeon]|nr:MAG: hypothetical protein BAJALOKI1v1_1390003 [Candidatus Lokiarchaeota archaeon]
MISAFAIILNEDILYCSDKEKYNLFESILFVEKLMKSINNIWRLDCIYFQDRDNNKGNEERILIKHIVTEKGDNLFYCISGDFNPSSQESYKMLSEYQKKVEQFYPDPESLLKPSKRSMMEEVIGVKTDFLKIQYNDKLKSEEIRNKISPTEYPYIKENKLLYCGLSTQGLPIISKLYNAEFFDNLDENADEEMIEVFCSKLSAKLATIAMNTTIRAQTNVKEIFIRDLNNTKHKIIILYGNINNYSLDFVSYGNLTQFYKVFHRLKQELSQEEILNKDFSGDLNPFRHLSKYLSNLTGFLCPRDDKAFVIWRDDCAPCIYHIGEHIDDIEADCDFPDIHWGQGDREKWVEIKKNRRFDKKYGKFSGRVIEDKGNAFDSHI